jgi:hypothetical protein
VERIEIPFDVTAAVCRASRKSGHMRPRCSEAFRPFAALRFVLAGWHVPGRFECVVSTPSAAMQIIESFWLFSVHHSLMPAA